MKLRTTDFLSGNDRTRRFGLAAIMAAFVALSFAYSLINPIFEAPDELWHFLNANYIRDNKALIVQTSDPLANPARQEGGQPPLYYILSAVAISWMPTLPAGEVALLNPYGQPGKPDSRLNRNVVIHGDDESFPFRDVSLAVHLLRAFSILLASGAVLTTYGIAREIFPESLGIQLGATAFHAFVPQFIFISSAVNNDNLVTLLSSLAILYLVKLGRGDTKGRNFLVLGIIVGLISLTKVSGLGILPVCAAVFLGVGLRNRSIAVPIKGALAVAAGIVLIGGWWYARNIVLYGDPLGMKVFLESINRSGASPEAAVTLASISTFIASFWALFGWSNVLTDSYVYWLFGGAGALAGLGLVHVGISKLRTPALTPSLLLLIPLSWLAVLVVTLLLWASTVGYDVGRLLFPAISGISILVIIGLAKLVGPRGAPWTICGLIAAMFIISAMIPVQYLRPAYKQGVQIVSREGAGARPLNATFGDKIRLVSYELSTDAAAPGQAVKVTTYWEPLPGFDDGLYLISLHLTSEDRQRSLGQVDNLLAEADIVKRARETGGLLRHVYELKVPVDVQQLTHLPIVVQAGHPATGWLEGYDGLMRPIGNAVVMARIRVGRPGE